MVEQEVIIPRPQEFEEKKLSFIQGGAENLHVLSDFDRTITYGLTKEGNRTATVISQLRSNPDYLGKTYSDEAYKLFDIYRPIEVDPNIPLEEKIIKMHEWWRLHFDLIAKTGLDKSLIERVVKERPLNFRAGAENFIRNLANKNIPLIFMSAAPGDMIISYLEANELMFPNVSVVANLYEFDKNGKSLRVKEPIIHTFNKKEIVLSDYPIFQKISSRKNVILMGDSIGDVDMVDGFKYNCLLKVGFLNEDIEKNLESFKENYDVVLTGDHDMSFVSNLLRDILK